MRLVLKFLFIILFSSGVLTQVKADNLSDNKADSILLVPVKIINEIPEGRFDVSLKYDNLLRITNVLFESFGKDTNVVSFKRDIKITYLIGTSVYDYTPKNFDIIDALDITDMYPEYDSRNKSIIYFTSKKVASDTIHIECESYSEKKEYWVDILSGSALRTKVYKKNDGEYIPSQEVKYDYDSVGNISAIVVDDFYNQAKFSSGNYIYDSNPSPFSNVTTPKWFLYSNLFTFIDQSPVNNIMSFDVKNDGCLDTVKIDIEYNTQGYPKVYKYSKDASPDSKCVSSSNLSYRIEYASVDSILNK